RRPPLTAATFPYPTLFRSRRGQHARPQEPGRSGRDEPQGVCEDRRAGRQGQARSGQEGLEGKGRYGLTGPSDGATSRASGVIPEALSVSSNDHMSVDDQRSAFLSALGQVRSLEDLEALRDQWLGRKAGHLTLELKKLGKIADPAERKRTG